MKEAKTPVVSAVDESKSISGGSSRSQGRPSTLLDSTQTLASILGNNTGHRDFGSRCESCYVSVDSGSSESLASKTSSPSLASFYESCNRGSWRALLNAGRYVSRERTVGEPSALRKSCRIQGLADYFHVLRTTRKDGLRLRLPWRKATSLSPETRGSVGCGSVHCSSLGENRTRETELLCVLRSLNRTIQGCSCRGGKSHTCLKVMGIDGPGPRQDPAVLYEAKALKEVQKPMSTPYEQVTKKGSGYPQTPKEEKEHRDRQNKSAEMVTGPAPHFAFTKKEQTATAAAASGTNAATSVKQEDHVVKATPASAKLEVPPEVKTETTVLRWRNLTKKVLGATKMKVEEWTDVVPEDEAPKRKRFIGKQTWNTTS